MRFWTFNDTFGSFRRFRRLLFTWRFLCVGSVQRTKFNHHGSCGPSLTGKTMSVFLIFTQGTHRNVKNRWVRSSLHMLQLGVERRGSVSILSAEMFWLWLQLRFYINVMKLHWQSHASLLASRLKATSYSRIFNISMRPVLDDQGHWRRFIR